MGKRLIQTKRRPQGGRRRKRKVRGTLAQRRLRSYQSSGGEGTELLYDLREALNFQIVVRIGQTG
jgi:hypothetical protein